MRARLGGMLAVAGVVCVLGSPARANDGSGEAGVGGTVRLKGPHASIQMVSEEIHIRLPECVVETRFVFHNDGPATSVLMIFPENGYLNGLQPNPELQAKYSHFQYFHAWVDGKPVKVTRVVQGKKEKDAENDDPSYEYWFTKRVSFAKGQTRLVVNRYQGGLGWGPLGLPEQTFGYIVDTGASWKGKIQRARIFCDMRGLRDNAPFSVSPEGYRPGNGDQIIWDFRDLRPTPKDDIRLAWIAGFANIRVNGKPVVGDKGWQEEWGRVAPRREGEHIWISLRTAAKWLGADMTVSNAGRTVRLTRGSHWAEVTVGSPKLQTTSATSALPYPTRIEAGYMMTLLQPLVSALGGTAAYDHSGTLAIQFPEKEKTAFYR